jgi:hypothetical protein
MTGGEAPVARGTFAGAEHVDARMLLYRARYAAIYALPPVAAAYHAFRHNLLDRFRKPPILVYQMGKVGSSTVARSLERARPGRSVYQVHHLRPDVVARRSKRGWRRRFAEVLDARHLAARVVRPVPGKWRVVTLVRDPVARNVSAFFQAMQTRQPDRLMALERAGAFDVAPLMAEYLADHPRHRLVLEWLDDELGAVFGVDVYARPFPHDKGFQVYESDRARVLLVRLEDLRRCAADAFATLGVDHFTLFNTNVGDRKAFGGAYRHFLEQVHFPEDYLDSVYNSRFARHLYSDAERAEFRKRWGGT